MAVTGAILGDIAGSQYEHRRPRDLDYKNCEIFTKDCHYTDDTVMTLAVKKALQHSLDIAETLQELGRKHPGAGFGWNFYDLSAVLDGWRLIYDERTDFLRHKLYPQSAHA